LSSAAAARAQASMLQPHLQPAPAERRRVGRACAMASTSLRRSPDEWLCSDMYFMKLPGARAARLAGAPASGTGSGAAKVGDVLLTGRVAGTMPTNFADAPACRPRCILKTSEALPTLVAARRDR